MLSALYGASINTNVWLWEPAQVVVKSRNVSEKPLKDCKNTIHIKDDILVFGVGQEHDKYLEDVLRMLQEKGNVNSDNLK